MSDIERDNPTFKSDSPFAAIATHGSDGWQTRPFNGPELHVILSACIVRYDARPDAGHGFNAGVTYSFAVLNESDHTVSGFVHVPQNQAFTLHDGRPVFVQSIAMHLTGINNDGAMCEATAPTFAYFDEYLQHAAHYQAWTDGNTNEEEHIELMRMAYAMGRLSSRKMMGYDGFALLSIDSMQREKGWVVTNPDMDYVADLRDKVCVYNNADRDLDNVMREKTIDTMSGYTIASLLTLLNPDGNTPQELEPNAVPDEQPLLTLDDSDMTWLEELLR